VAPELFDVFERRWARLILDEAHELCDASAAVQRAVLAVAAKSDAVHLLSATPERGDGSCGAASLALLFKAALCPRAPDQLSFVHHGDAETTAAAAAFFRSVARTKASPFELPVTEHVVRVQLTQAEKVLYAHAKESYVGRRALLELCCCFVVTASSAAKEIGVLVRKKNQELVDWSCRTLSQVGLLDLLARSAGETELLRTRRAALQCTRGSSELWEMGRREAEELFDGVHGSEPGYVAEGVVAQHLVGAKTRCLLAATTAAFGENLRRLYAPPPHEPEKVREALDEQLLLLGQSYCAYGALRKSLLFLEKSLEELAAGGGSCPVCLDGLENGEAVSMTSCGHAFHADCIAEVRRSQTSCPTCRQPGAEVYATKPPAPVDPWLKYGTKVKAIIEKLKEIMREHPGERLLLFAQYRCVRKKLEQAFREFGVPFLTLCGSTREQGAAVTRWQSGRHADDFVMMLSCEEHNSGITLTRARRAGQLERGRERGRERERQRERETEREKREREKREKRERPKRRCQAHHVRASLRRALQRGRGHGEASARPHQPHRAAGRVAGAVARRHGGHHRAGDTGAARPRARCEARQNAVREVASGGRKASTQLASKREASLGASRRVSS